MRAFGLSIVFVCVVLFCTRSFAEGFRPPFADTTTDIEGRKIAVVLGAGPGGLVAAKTILAAQKIDLVLVVEKRSEFSRYNMVNFFPESWPMLRALGIADVFSNIATPTEFFSFYFDYQNGVETFSLNAENIPESFDYRGPVKEIFARPRVGLQVVQIAELQNRLATSLSQDPKIHFIHGDAIIADTPVTSGKHKVVISTAQKDVYSLVPDLVVIAEGAHSVNRAHLGIAIKPVLKQQLWCSGSVTLPFAYSQRKPFIHVLERIRPGVEEIRNFGIFNVKSQTLFLNGEAKDASETVTACLLRNAIALLDNVPARPASEILRSAYVESFLNLRTAQGLISITPSKAAQFSRGTNVILFGDAAGYGTPKGGIGLSMLTTVYPQALLDLLENWQAPRSQALRTYSARVNEIVDYWHDRIASDDMVL